MTMRPGHHRNYTTLTDVTAHYRAMLNLTRKSGTMMALDGKVPYDKMS
jgi:hypothetical protein